MLIKSKAKINLFLHVTGKTSNNYHLLDSMVMFAEDLYDEIEIDISDVNRITVDGPWSKNLVGINLVERVVEKFSSIVALPKLDIKIKKNIPIGGGLGGGSANAASVIKYLADTFLPKLTYREIVDICITIGADVTPCFHSKSLYFNGIGDIISPIEKTPDIYAIIVYPGFSINTKEIFSIGFTKFSDEIIHFSQFHNYNHLWDYLSRADNHLFENIKTHKSDLASIIHALNDLPECKLGRMTGSGSACFGLFESKDRALLGAKALQKKFSRYSIYTTQLV